MLQIKYIRGNTAANDLYVGEANTFSVDTEAKNIRIHDGVTAGGSIVPGISSIEALETMIANLGITDINGLQSALDLKVNSGDLDTAIDTALAGAIGVTIPGLVDGLIPLANLPNSLEDVVEASDFASLPATGSSQTLYVTLDTGTLYRWGGSVYVAIPGAVGTSDDVVEGSVNQYFTLARAREAIGISGTPLTYNSTTGVIGLQVADNTVTIAGAATDSVVTPAGVRAFVENMGFSEIDGTWYLDQGNVA